MKGRREKVVLAAGAHGGGTASVPVSAASCPLMPPLDLAQPPLHCRPPQATDPMENSPGQEKGSSPLDQLLEAVNHATA